MRFAVIDTEGGGLNPLEHSLLTVGVVIIDLPMGDVVAEAEFKVLETPLIVQREALEVNRINLKEHRAEADTPVVVAKRLTTFLKEHITGPIRIAGHNVGYDVEMLRRLWRQAGYMAPLWPFHYATLDTASVGYMTTMVFPAKPWDSPSLDTMLLHYNVPIEEKNRHTALGDAQATAELLARMLIELRYPDENEAYKGTFIAD